MSKILVIAEHEAGQLKLATLSAVAFSSKLAAETSGSFEILVIGNDIAGVAERLRGYGASGVLVADAAPLKHPLSDKYAQLIVEIVRQRQPTFVVGAASTFSKDILPRAAALLDAAMLSDITQAQPDGDDFIFRRVMFAGNVIATVKLGGALKFLTIRPAAFVHPAKGAGSSPVISVPVTTEKLPA